MKEIHLTQGKVAKVSDRMFEYLNQWKWQAEKHKKNGKLYATRREYPSRKRIWMHQEVLKAPDGMDIDHWDGDGLNNQDENLRVCTRSQNQANRKLNPNNTSGYKGVTRHRKGWRARLGKDMKRISKTLPTAIEAAKAYDEMAKEQFGEFASLNFPE